MKKTLYILSAAFMAAVVISACDNGKSPWRDGDCGPYYGYIQLNDISAFWVDYETGEEIPGDVMTPAADYIPFGITFAYRFITGVSRSVPGIAAANALSCPVNGTEGLTSGLKTFTVTCDKAIGEIPAGQDMSSLVTIKVNNGPSEIDTLAKWLKAVHDNGSPLAVELLFRGIDAELAYDDWPIGDYTITVKITNDDDLLFLKNLPKITVPDPEEEEGGEE